MYPCLVVIISQPRYRLLAVLSLFKQKDLAAFEHFIWRCTFSLHEETKNTKPYIITRIAKVDCRLLLSLQKTAFFILFPAFHCIFLDNTLHCILLSHILLTFARNVTFAKVSHGEAPKPSRSLYQQKFLS